MSRFTLLITATLGCFIGDVITFTITFPLIHKFIDVISYTIIFGGVIITQVVFLVWMYFDMTKEARERGYIK